MLRSISQAGKGVYYYVKKEEEIPSSFADCLGGLLSVVAQNITLTITTKGTTKITKALTTYKTKEIEQSKIFELNIGDMYSEERKDVVFILDLPKLEAESNNHEIVDVKLSYFNAISKENSKSSQTCSIKRPEKCEKLIANYELDKQKNRVETTAALDEARALADKNLLSEARDVLNKMVDNIKKSASAEDPFCVALINDLKSLLVTFQDTKSYVSYGNKMVNNMWTSHEYQRSNNQEENSSAQVYENSAKKK